MSDLVPFLKLLTKVGYPNPEIQTIARMADYNLEEFLPDLVEVLGEEKADEFTQKALNKMSTSYLITRDTIQKEKYQSLQKELLNQKILI